MGVKVELHGGPHDGQVLHIDQARQVIRMTDESVPLELTDLDMGDDPRVTGPAPSISCYHLEDRRPRWGRWRYRYHGSA